MESRPAESVHVHEKKPLIRCYGKLYRHLSMFT
jgi:hypothetical protein